MGVLDKIKSRLTATRTAWAALGEDLTRIRRRLKEINAECDLLSNTVVTTAEAKERALEVVEAIKAEAKHYVVGDLASSRFDPSKVARLMTRNAVARADGVVVQGVANASELLALGAPDVLVSAMMARYEDDVQARGLPRMASQERHAKEQALLDEAEVLARTEELLIREAEDAGLFVDRRSDAEPRIVLAPAAELA